MSVGVGDKKLSKNSGGGGSRERRRGGGGRRWGWIIRGNENIIEIIKFLLFLLA